MPGGAPGRAEEVRAGRRAGVAGQLPRARTCSDRVPVERVERVGARGQIAQLGDPHRQLRLHRHVLHLGAHRLGVGQGRGQPGETGIAQRGAVEGATYTDVNAQLPALNLLHQDMELDERQRQQIFEQSMAAIQAVLA